MNYLKNLMYVLIGIAACLAVLICFAEANVISWDIASGEYLKVEIEGKVYVITENDLRRASKQQIRDIAVWEDGIFGCTIQLICC